MATFQLYLVAGCSRAPDTYQRGELKNIVREVAQTQTLEGEML